MLKAYKELKAIGGGIVVHGVNEKASLKLEIGGIITNRSAKTASKEVEDMEKLLKNVVLSIQIQYSS